MSDLRMPYLNTTVERAQHITYRLIGLAIPFTYVPISANEGRLEVPPDEIYINTMLDLDEEAKTKYAERLRKRR